MKGHRNIVSLILSCVGKEKYNPQMSNRFKTDKCLSNRFSKEKQE